MNLHINLTSLEGKYIDLANFYKQELLNRNKEKDVQRVKVSSVTAKKNIKSLRPSQHSSEVEIDPDHQRLVIQSS